MSDLERARAAKEVVAARCRDRDGVVGVGLERLPDGYAVRVNVRAVAAADGVPEAVDGVPVRVVVTGAVRAQG